MRTHPSMWLLRALWLALPFTAGDAIGAATDGRLASVRAAAAVLAWLAWAIGMIAAAVPHPLALTAQAAMRRANSGKLHLAREDFELYESYPASRLGERTIDFSGWTAQIGLRAYIGY